jgi:trehalose 6-phosphate phosphatase
VYESVSNTDQPVTLVETVVELLASGTAGLVTDVDGTISPIVPHPEDALVLPLAKAALEALRDRLAIVGIVSGRAVSDARAMVGIDGLVYVGNHGLELWNVRGAEVLPEARPWVPRLASVLEDVRQRVRTSGIAIENKGVTASLHYRLAEEPDQARRELLEILAQCALTSGLRLEEGRRVLNLLPPLTVTKGSAVSWLAEEHKLDRLVYLGDDVTDAHAFKALNVLRTTGGIETLCIGVVGPETPLGVRQLANANVTSVEAVAELLWAVSDRLESRDSIKARAPSARSDINGQQSGRAHQ